MGKIGKKYAAARQRVEPRPYRLPDAMKLVREVKYAKFDESVDIAMLLGVDPKHADQNELAENAEVFIRAVHKAKPPAAKGTYFRTVSISSTMGPGIEIDTTSIEAL